MKYASVLENIFIFFLLLVSSIHHDRDVRKIIPINRDDGVIKTGYAARRDKFVFTSLTLSLAVKWH